MVRERLRPSIRRWLASKNSAGNGVTVRLGVGGKSLLELRQDRHGRQCPPREAGLFHAAFLLPSRSALACCIIDRVFVNEGIYETAATCPSSSGAALDEGAGLGFSPPRHKEKITSLRPILPDFGNNPTRNRTKPGPLRRDAARVGKGRVFPALAAQSCAAGVSAYLPVFSGLQ